MHVGQAHETIERRRIRNAFRSAGALAPDRARTLERLGLKDSSFIRNYRAQQIVREVGDGEFYLDEDALREHQSMMLKWLAVPLVLVLMLIIYAIAASLR
jgi:hypothetical protein